MTNPSVPELGRVVAAAEPFAKCQHRWDNIGYPPPSIYTCLDREIDIAKPGHQTLDWWPHHGRCDGCNLAEALGAVGTGTLTWKDQQHQFREADDRRDYERLRRKYEVTVPASGDDRPAGT